jgi:3-dehydroquinate synthase class II
LACGRKRVEKALEDLTRGSPAVAMLSRDLQEVQLSAQPTERVGEVEFYLVEIVVRQIEKG